MADLPASRNGWTHAIASNDEAVVVTGGSDDPARPGNWVSADGIAWTATPAADRDGLARVESLAASSGGFVATQSGVLGVAPWISPADGRGWRHVGSVTAAPDAVVTDVTAAGRGFVAVGFKGWDAAAWVSADGRTWIPGVIAGSTGVTLGSVAASASRLVAFGKSADFRRGARRFHLGRRRAVLAASRRWRPP